MIKIKFLVLKNYRGVLDPFSNNGLALFNERGLA